MFLEGLLSTMRGSSRVGRKSQGHPILVGYWSQNVGFNTFEYQLTAGFPGFLTTLPSGVNNIMHDSCPRTMQGGSIPINIVQQLGCSSISWSSKRSPTIWIAQSEEKKMVESRLKVDELLLMYIGSPLQSMFSSIEKGTVGALEQCTHWTKSSLRSRIRNRCLTAMVGVEKRSTCAMLHVMQRRARGSYDAMLCALWRQVKGMATLC